MEATKAPEPTKITATELARNLSDILNRVRYKGESFIVERNGEVVGELAPAKRSKTSPSRTSKSAMRSLSAPEKSFP